ncbi:MAG TPA: GNAT family N-acetyltransferase [Sphingomicrobium sp.]
MLSRYTASVTYDFRPVTAADLPLLRSWRAQLHWTEWWGDAQGDEGFFEAALADPHTACWLVELGGRAIAYAQDYDPHAWPGHHFAHLPPRSRGVDQSIGPAELVGQGHGSAFVRAHVERLFAAGAPAVGTDPDPDNARAIRAYEKAGFTIAGGPVDTHWGRALLMECRPFA